MWLSNSITMPTTTGYAIPNNPDDLEQWIKSKFNVCPHHLCRKCWKNRYPYHSYQIKNWLQYIDLSRYLTIGEIRSNSNSIRCSIGSYLASPKRNSRFTELKEGRRETHHTQSPFNIGSVIPSQNK